jgi:hypothetical protein
MLERSGDWSVGHEKSVVLSRQQTNRDSNSSIFTINRALNIAESADHP